MGNVFIGSDGIPREQDDDGAFYVHDEPELEAIKDMEKEFDND